MATFTLRVNGQNHPVDVEPDTPLLFVLSDDLALRGPKFGCGPRSMRIVSRSCSKVKRFVRALLR
jgi:aerobic-type carbon monoxide dehydrogenase small subunit (CoxS/CutS family)